MSAFWDNPSILLAIIIIILIVDHLWGIYLLLREIFTIKSVQQVPEPIRMYLPQDLFNRMRAYKLHKTWLVVINTLVVVVICGCLELALGFYAFVWNIALKCAPFQWMRHEVWTSIVYVFLLSEYLFLKSLPATIYEKFCIPPLHKRQPESIARKICREVFDFILTWIIICIVVVILVYLMLFMGNYSFIGLYLLLVICTIIVILALPFTIDPILGKRVQLQNQALQRDLERLAASVDFPPKQVHVVRMHDSNSGSNAFFYGSCCLKRIVIFDTLILNRGLRDISELAPDEVGKGLSNAQVIAVVAHELGHWYHKHFYKAICMFQMHLLLMMALFGLLFPRGPIYQAVGFEPGVQPVLVGLLIILGFVLTPYLTLANCFMLYVTRHFEYEADEFAWELGYARDLRYGLLKLYADNLSFPISDRCYSIWNHTHPTMLQRLEHLKNLEDGFYSNSSPNSINYQ